MDTSKNLSTGFIFDERFLHHNAGRMHPESPKRLTVTMDFLNQKPWFSQLQSVSTQSADEESLFLVHSSAYIERAKESCAGGWRFLDTADVGICEDSFAIAKLAAGSVLALGDAVMQKQIQNGFALIRPPGHHAEENQAMGFCLFNNIAILAKYLQKKYGLEKVLILDWDAHHGNGTQHAFEEDPSVFYASLHQYPFYPGTGAWHEQGVGRGKGSTLNCPMSAGAGDKEFETAFVEKILPAANHFKPEIVLISAGFDAHKADPLASLNVSTEFYGWMTERMKEVAAKHSQSKIISLLEGGYNLDFLPESIALHIEKLLSK